MAGKPRTPRGERRARARAHEEMVHDLDRLAKLKPGGAPTHPLVVTSPAQVDVIAAATPCPLCEGTLHLEEHAAETIDGEWLRVARMHCAMCGTRRELYFRVSERTLH